MCTTPHAPRGVLYLVPMLFRMLIGGCNPMLCPMHVSGPPIKKFSSGAIRDELQVCALCLQACFEPRRDFCCRSM